jgi:septal ring factor EnvC (AmiA/AmiB activator)
MLATLLLVAAIPGCSSKPGEAEMKQLEELKAEVASLEKEVQNKESEKAAVQRAIADKDAQVKKCNDDKAMVDQRLKGM